LIHYIASTFNLLCKPYVYISRLAIANDFTNDFCADIDPSQDVSPLLAFIAEAGVFHEFAHARDPFAVHLRGTWHILAHWQQHVDTCRCGLLHSAYTRDGFFFRYFDIHQVRWLFG
jgi:hypothetical protein